MSVTDGLWYTTKLDLVPAITDEEIAEMRHIEPLIQEGDSCWYHRVVDQQLIDPRRESCIWDAKPEAGRLAFGPLNSLRIITFHDYGAPVLFKPSLAEVYASIRRFVSDWRHIGFFHLQSGNMGPGHVVEECHWCFCDLFGYPEVSDG